MKRLNKKMSMNNDNKKDKSIRRKMYEKKENARMKIINRRGSRRGQWRSRRNKRVKKQQRKAGKEKQQVGDVEEEKCEEREGEERESEGKEIKEE